MKRETKRWLEGMVDPRVEKFYREPSRDALNSHAALKAEVRRLRKVVTKAVAQSDCEDRHNWRTSCSDAGCLGAELRAALKPRRTR